MTPKTVNSSANTAATPQTTRSAATPRRTRQPIARENAENGRDQALGASSSAPFELPDRVRTQIAGTACRILGRLEPGSAWTPAELAEGNGR